MFLSVPLFLLQLGVELLLEFVHDTTVVESVFGVKLVKELSFCFLYLELVVSHLESLLDHLISKLLGVLFDSNGKISLVFIKSRVWWVDAVGPQKGFYDKLEVDINVLFCCQGEDDSES